MPRIKITGGIKYRKQNDENQSYVPNTEQNFQLSENCNTDSQCDQTCDSVQPSLNCQTDLKQAHENSEQCATVSSLTQYLQTQNCFRTTDEPLHNSLDSQDCNKHSQLDNKLHIKSELCYIDSNAHSTVSEGVKEIESHSEDFQISDGTCVCEIDHPNNCAIVEAKSSKQSDAENCADSSSCQEPKRSRRNSKRKRDLEDHCPVCGLTVRCTELESHFTKEVENLSNIAKNIRKPRSLRYDHRAGFRRGINLAFLQAKGNREARIKAKKEIYMRRHVIDCPMCKETIEGTDEEINEHVLNCFGEDDESDINVTDYEDNFEEYEIGDETRVRAISLVPGGHRSLHGYSSKSKPANDDEDDDLNVDVDDTQSFGKPQYTELDVIRNECNTSDERVLEQLRRAVISDPSAKRQVIEGKKWTQHCEIQNEIDEITSSCVKTTPNEEKSNENEVGDTEAEENIQHAESDIISSLKKRIRDLEQQKCVKCLICLEPYTRPVVSTTCWHVHCEECWLVSMGVKKLCPQCNMIVFPTDLRRIYL